MGTNFYWTPSPPPDVARCPTCGHGTANALYVPKHHIGKRSGGWTFTFQTCPDLKVRSYADWLRVFAEDPEGRIYDEYGERMVVDDFKAMVEARKRETHNHAREYPRNAYLDPEGHSFSDYEFS